jgi:(E)-4-hydroxy-3-methyl-but-2-enyl pyrophosphate reductase
MKIITAKNIGFCSGVRMAISIAETALKEKKGNVQLLGSLVHNERVVNRLIKKGLIFRKNLEEIKPGILIIQAHGFPPLPENIKRKVSVRDATCPLVKKVQELALSLKKQGYQIIIIGDKNHSEVKGIKGHLGEKNKALIIKDEKDSVDIPPFDKIAVVAQTTQELENIKKTLKTLKKKNSQIKYFNTLCPEVQTRQKQAREIAKKSEAVLVIGSRMSANTGRLYQIVKKTGKPVFWVNSLKDLEKENLNKIKTLGLISGTSADDKEIEEILKWLKNKR